jgi:hypothetical protein
MRMDAPKRLLEPIGRYYEVTRKHADLIVYVRTKQNFHDLHLTASSFCLSTKRHKVG